MPNLVKPERQKKKKNLSTSLQSLLPVLITTQKQPHAEIHLPKVAGNISNKKKIIKKTTHDKTNEKPTPPNTFD